LEIQNSTAQFETSLTSAAVSVELDAAICVVSNHVPVAGVITVPAGIITRRSPTGLNTTAPVLLIVIDCAFVVVPEIVDTVHIVQAVTTVETIPERPELYDSELVVSVPVASAANANCCHTELARSTDMTQREINCFFIWK
jgi:hypothetical protein